MYIPTEPKRFYVFNRYLFAYAGPNAYLRTSQNSRKPKGKIMKFNNSQGRALSAASPRLFGALITMALVACFAYSSIVSYAQTKDSNGKMMAGMKGRVKMMADPLAERAGLQSATGHAEVDVDKGTVELTVMLADGTQLPEGTVLEGWLSTAGRKGGPGMSTASERDQKYGPAFGKEDLAMQSRDIPYALSTGLLKRKGNSQTYVGKFKIDNPLTPYGAVAVTLESDGNVGTYDPRPGSPLMAGMIKEGMMTGAKMTGSK